MINTDALIEIHSIAVAEYLVPKSDDLTPQAFSEVRAAQMMSSE